MECGAQGLATYKDGYAGFAGLDSASLRRGVERMSELNVNSESHLTQEVNSLESVNSKPKNCFDVNVKLSQQMRQILLFLFKDVDHVYQQVDIIKAVYGNVTASKKASFSRAIKALIKAGLVGSRKAYYSEKFGCWFRQRICFFLTEKGGQFVKEKLIEVS